jgi:16S rRNA processing protein RimM
MRLVVARIGRAHGIRGEVTVEVRTDVPEQRLVVGADLYPVPLSEGGGGSAPTRLTLTSARDHRGRWLLGFAGVDNRDAAEALRGLLLEADVPEQVEENAWYDHELIGCVVRDVAGHEVGSVLRVDHLPAQDLLVIRTRTPGPERLVPFVAALVPEVDVAQGWIVVDDPGGLLGDPPDRRDATGPGVRPDAEPGVGGTS